MLRFKFGKLDVGGQRFLGLAHCQSRAQRVGRAHRFAVYEDIELFGIRDGGVYFKSNPK